MKFARSSLLAAWWLTGGIVCTVFGNPIDLGQQQEQQVIREDAYEGGNDGGRGIWGNGNRGGKDQGGGEGGVGISPELFGELDELARIVDISYCVGTPSLGITPPFTCLSFCSDFPSFELIQTWNTGPLLSDSCGYIALSHPPARKRIIVAFRGTYSITNALVDLSTGQQEYVPYPPSENRTKPPGDDDPVDPGNRCMGCWAHKGFLTSWRAAAEVVVPVVQDLIHNYAPQGYELILVGHSLGGAVAALAALEFVERGWHPTVTTFGEPKPGNIHLATYLNSHFTSETYRRVTHKSDPVPLLPFRDWGFIHHETELYIEKVELPPMREDVKVCEGNEDEKCAVGGSEDGILDRINIVQLVYAHRDYFHRIGLCVPQNWRGGFKEWLPPWWRWWNWTVNGVEVMHD